MEGPSKEEIKAFTTRVEEEEKAVELARAQEKTENERKANESKRELTAGEEKKRRQRKVRKEKKREEKIRKAMEENVKESAGAICELGVKKDGGTLKPGGKCQQSSPNEENERKILVRSLNENKDKLKYINAAGNVIEDMYRMENYHIVDLKQNKIYRDCLPSLPEASGIGSMVAVGQSSSIFIFGGLDPLPENSSTSLYKEHKNQSSSSKLHFYTGASHLRFDPSKDLKDDNGCRARWGPAPFPIDGPYRIIFTSLNGDVYSFGLVNLTPQVLHLANSAAAGKWKSLGPLPPKLVGCYLHIPVIPDPKNNRLLLHLYGGCLPSPSLYAFYPLKNGGPAGGGGGGGVTWKCIDSNLPYWGPCAALVDGILYLHGRKFPNLVRAYEVSTGKWLEVKWSTRVIEEEEFSIDDVDFTFDSLFCVDEANGVLCLAVYSPVARCVSESPPSNRMILYFLKFRAEHHRGSSSSTVCLTPLHTREYEIASASHVLNFLLL